MIYRISTTKNKSGWAKVAGFTLVELMLVIVLMTIGTVAIVPGLGRSIPGWEAKEESMNMLSTIRMARQFALTGQRATGFILNANNTGYAVKALADSGDLHSKDNDFLIVRKFSGKSVKITQLEGFERIGNKEVLVFWPDGRGGDAHIKLTADADSGLAGWDIYIKADGSVNLEEVFAE